MTRKEIVDEIVKLQHELGMTLEELKAFMLDKTGENKIQWISEAGLVTIRALLRAKAKGDEIPVNAKVTSPGEKLEALDDIQPRQHLRPLNLSEEDLEVLDIPGVVVPVITEKEAIEHFKQLEKFKSAVLIDADYMFKDKSGKTCSKEEASTKYIKKSGWEKIALRFNISIENLTTNGIKGVDGDGGWHGVVVKIRAVAQNGRFVEVEGVCTTRNRFFCKRWDADKKIHRWIDTDEKNLFHTAQTVAINRAVSYLVGSGESSAEEVE